MSEIQKGKQHFVSITIPNSASCFSQASEQLINRATFIRTSHFLFTGPPRMALMDGMTELFPFPVFRGLWLCQFLVTPSPASF